MSQQVPWLVVQQSLCCQGDLVKWDEWFPATAGFRLQSRGKLSFLTSNSHPVSLLLKTLQRLPLPNPPPRATPAQPLWLTSQPPSPRIPSQVATPHFLQFPHTPRSFTAVCFCTYHSHFLEYLLCLFHLESLYSGPDERLLLPGSLPRVGCSLHSLHLRLPCHSTLL